MKRWIWRITKSLTALSIVAAAAGVLVLRSEWFRQYLQQRIVDVAERATGGRAEMGRFAFDWWGLKARVDNFVLHGAEPAADPPFVRVDAVTLGLKIISVLERKVDLASLIVERPQVRILVYPDGSTNIPGPERRRGGRIWTEPFLNLAIGAYEINDGVFEYDHRRTPFHLRGENLKVRMERDPQGPAYQGEFSSDGLNVTPPDFARLETSVNAAFRLERDRIVFPRLHVATGDTSADLEGTLENLRAPRGSFSIRAASAVREAVRLFRLPVEPAGSAAFNGDLRISFEDKFDYDLRGRVTARGLNYTRGRIRVSGAQLAAAAEVSPAGLRLRSMTAQALDANIAGELRLERWRGLRVEGRIEALNMRRAAEMMLARPLPWDGTLSGTFSTAVTLGQPDLVLRANMDILPVPGAQRLEGHVEVAYDETAQTLALGSSSVSTPATRVELSGTLGRSLRVQMRSTNLDDLLPALAVVREDAPASLPLKLNNGSLTLDGIVRGSAGDPHFTGQVAIVNGQVNNYLVDRFSAEADASLRQVLARNIRASRSGVELTGSAALTARPAPDPASGQNRFRDAEVTGQLNVRNIRVQDLLREAGSAIEASGTAAASVRISGSVQSPQAEMTLEIASLEAFGERFDALRMQAAYRSGELRVSEGVAADGPAQIRFSGRYAHETANYRNGEITFELASGNLPTSRLERVARMRPAVSATLNGKLSGAARLENGKFTLTSATADLSARGLRVEGEDISDFTVAAETRGSRLSVNAAGNIRESQIRIDGAWTLEGDAPGTANIRFSRMSLNSLHALSRIGDTAGDRGDLRAVEGFVEGGATVTLPLERLDAFRAVLTLSAIQVNSPPGQAFGFNIQPQDLVIRNSRPVVVDVSTSEARIRSAEFTGRDMTMVVSGALPFEENAPADFAVRGNINLLILQLVSPDLLARGNASLEASVRGSLQSPVISGRLSFGGASVYLKDAPAGLDNTSGVVLFDRNRATIERLTAETSGGQVSFTGFVEIRQPLVYRLQAEARQIRVRYPQDVSSRFDANLALNGTSLASTLSGVVTLNRATISQRADLGQLLAQVSRPTLAAATPSDYLGSMQIDVRVVSTPNLRLDSPLTSEMEVDVDLRLLGTPQRPILLGSVAINRGQMQVFGNRYNIDRGDIRFLSRVRIEPSFAIDLSTRARGVTVNLSVSGTVQRLSVNYSSDPPLQPSEIIALLAVGRDPAATANQLAPGAGANAASAFLETGGSLLGQAASQQVSNRLQRFFGATRVKIDPTLTGVDNLPQARLTFEQQVSKDVTLTYITNLNRTAEQVVRMQWDVSREWSAIAVRDQNGLFGIDFQFRKRF